LVVWTVKEVVEEIAYYQIWSCNSGGRWVKRRKV
jgi:hypothetical protein